MYINIGIRVNSTVHKRVTPKDPKPVKVLRMIINLN
ncbi:hypothetical protein ACQ27_gp267 [Klebsiella phage K64-1]|nr:hypothetical protein ACQ27_gp267 [Klebsiella phage K64-1]QOE32631.1 hypothetical protein CPT_Muenster_461 [Klebsiella phage Muenster]